MGLLSSVSKYYKMSFDKNVLIYVQRPDAGLLATKMGWEKQTGRYLKSGSKGIGVVDMNNLNAPFHHDSCAPRSANSMR